MRRSTTIWAKHALTADGWCSDVCVDIDDAGVITRVAADQPAAGERVDLLLPAMANLHSHAFQRAMAGMTETRSADSQDSFWSWRRLMYRFLQQLSPAHVEAIAAFVQMEMLESGYASVGEFHYLHHQVDGLRYQNVAEMSERILAAGDLTGIGLTLLPVMYEQGGCDGRALEGGQRRFGNNLDQFNELLSGIDRSIESNATDADWGIAPHSLRAVNRESLSRLHSVAAGRPFHIHVAEQHAEVDELLASYGARPVQWLLDNMPVDHHYCLIHATQMTPSETESVANSGAVVGLCPITESNLGDGIFDGKRYFDHNGAWGIGTDSNVRISLSEELRTLEYSQRLQHNARAVYATPQHSNGRLLYQSAAIGGAQALQRQCGCIAAGYLADLVALDSHSPSFVAVTEDQWIDAWVFANDDRLVTDVWSAGRHMVSGGQHIHREQIEAVYRAVMADLVKSL